MRSEIKPAAMAPAKDPADIEAVICPAILSVWPRSGQRLTYTSLQVRVGRVKVVEVLVCAYPRAHGAIEIS
jgi:hypothetical protein